jgi:hypothetical protein
MGPVPQITRRKSSYNDSDDMMKSLELSCETEPNCTLHTECSGMRFPHEGDVE